LGSEETDKKSKITKHRDPKTSKEEICSSDPREGKISDED